jgi:2-phospho-L-lactate guanylyltransferase
LARDATVTPSLGLTKVGPDRSLTFAVVPYRGGELAKSRLSPAMSAADRALLAGRLVDHVLLAVRRSEGVSGIVVVSNDSIDGVALLADPGRGLNAALEAGIRRVEEQGAQTVLIVPADLPFLTPADIDILASAGGDADRAGAVAPSKDGGTGGLLLRPPSIVEPRFGVDSGARHAAALRSAGVEPAIVQRSGLALDIDVPEDLDLLGDELLDIVWSRDGNGLGGAIYRADEAGEYLARPDLDE